ncbi:hypothetical protein Xcel_1084 [Xylanimonas cellulosilytica DSM 15894]|uniref:Uncharacterized protein n=1 Tax=Xylanimonas cellulosilytica (strain DSM 15894 / JCM 12276 / CECT 5975 / KCTC 9989 / LMG 20990 / NBRC 107835 / XIL07) TaxID=446471 RepID=D1BZG1_XYLCX|nr:hypothetical protein [Xylanimonas cellulosilytica]ACZ30115.1 hypothetical protein Xcel_1084 [Xylanimonas cellulosilytica DSM 15894]
MSPELTADLVEVAHPRRHRQAKTSRQVRRLERHLRKLARRLDHAQSASRRLARERRLDQTTQLLIIGNWRQV